MAARSRHPGSSELVVVPDMQERKREMFALSDAVAVLPGGFGTLDEAFEAITLRQLGFFEKPIVLVDTAGLLAADGRDGEANHRRPALPDPMRCSCSRW